MANEIATRSAPAPTVMPFDAMQRLAESIAKSGLFGIRTTDQALTLMSIAQAEGRHPALAARDYHIIQGTPAKKAEAMLRDFLSAGGHVEWHTLTDDAAEATFSHPAGGSVRISWDATRVKRAELDKNAMHRKYPRQMLRSRVVSEGVRTVWPMATSGMYVPEEVADFAAPHREPIDITPKADLDAFASAQRVDSETGEVIGDAALLAQGDAEAEGGSADFTAWWNSAEIKPLRNDLRLHLARWRVIATAADERAAPPQAEEEDPFGLPPIATEQPSAEDRPERDAAGIAGPDDGGAPEPIRPDEPAAAADLLGAPPAENLTVPLPQTWTFEESDYFARQMRALIAERPGDRQRIARIRKANENGTMKLKAAAPAIYDELMAALTAARA